MGHWGRVGEVRHWVNGGEGMKWGTRGEWVKWGTGGEDPEEIVRRRKNQNGHRSRYLKIKKRASKIAKGDKNLCVPFKNLMTKMHPFGSPLKFFFKKQAKAKHIKKEGQKRVQLAPTNKRLLTLSKMKLSTDFSIVTDQKWVLRNKE